MINEWIASIVGVVVLGILMDMVIPTGNLKTYTRFFIGLITLMIVLQPILKLLGQLPEFEKVLWSETMAMELETLKSQSQAVEISQDKYLMELYKKRFEQDIVNQVKRSIKTQNITADVTIVASNDESMFTINRIDIMIDHPKQLKIKPIEIAIDSKSEKNTELSVQELENKDYEIIRQLISDTYEIEISRIYINDES